MKRSHEEVPHAFSGFPLALHALGFDDCGNGKPYRNYYVAAVFSEDLMQWHVMTKQYLADEISSTSNKATYKLSKRGVAHTVRAVSIHHGRKNCFTCCHCAKETPFCMKRTKVIEDIVSAYLYHRICYECQ